MKHNFIITGMILCMAQGHAQNINHQGARTSIDEFRKEARKNMDDFRQQCLKEYASFVQNPWKMFEETKPIPIPKKEEIPPMVKPEEEKKPIEDKPIIIDEVIKPAPVEPQPQPLEPIKEVPIMNQPTLSFSFYGTGCNVRFDKSKLITLQSASEKEVAHAIECMGSADYDNLIVDCLRLRDELQLNDWAYLQLLKALSINIVGSETNESTLIMAYLYMQSGYKMRLASNNGKLYLLFASRHVIYNKNSYTIDGNNYYGIEELPNRLHICQASFPKEKSLSLLINHQPKFSTVTSPKRVISSKRYSDMSLTVCVNRNLIDFYNTYPTSMVDYNVMTSWAMYANTPISDNVKNQLYDQLNQKLGNKNQLEGVSKLLNWVQTGFVYEYDDKVWGHDRIFFAEETLFYPYADCEDRSILLSRLVRDILGLNTILIYYPGHLAMAVEFTEQVTGDYIMLNGKRFIVCDPTYIGAPVGETMPNMDNQKAKVILLK